MEMSDQAREAIWDIVYSYQDKGYDVRRVVLHQPTRERWEIYDNDENLKGLIVYRADRGPVVSWHTSWPQTTTTTRT